MTREELQELLSHLDPIWQPLADTVLAHDAAQREELARLKADLQAELKEFKEAYRNITVEEMGYTLREVEALGIDFQKEVVGDGHALHDVVMTRIAVLRQAEKRLSDYAEKISDIVNSHLESMPRQALEALVHDNAHKIALARQENNTLHADLAAMTRERDEYKKRAEWKHVHDDSLELEQQRRIAQLEAALKECMFVLRKWAPQCGIDVDEAIEQAQRALVWQGEAVSKYINQLKADLAAATELNRLNGEALTELQDTIRRYEQEDAT